MSSSASRHRPTTARGRPSSSRMGRYSCTMPVSFGSAPAASIGWPASMSTGGGVVPLRALAMAAEATPSSPTADGASLTITRPSRLRSSNRTIESFWLSVASISVSSAARAALGPSAPRSPTRRLALTKSATRDASRDATVFRVAVESRTEVTATSALAVTPTSTRTTPMTSARSIGRRPWRVVDRASTMGSARWQAGSRACIGDATHSYHAVETAAGPTTLYRPGRPGPMAYQWP